jgi:predicted Holliday junction resolvase-like endonuclease
MNKRMDILKNSKEKHRWYPKNVLVFGIAAVEKRFLGVEAAIKRHVVEANRNEIKDDIVTKLTKTKKRLEVKPEDKPYTRKLKEDIKKAIEDAQKEFYKQLESKIVG